MNRSGQFQKRTNTNIKQQAMKNLIVLISFSLLIISCQKDSLLKSSEIPDWLKDRIAQDEEIIRTNPQSGLQSGAWFRYKNAEGYYFGYINNLSSAFQPLYDFNGDQIIFGGNNEDFDEDSYRAFYNSLCCKVVVWKGEAYIDLGQPGN